MSIHKVAILGAGTMGSQIAAHLANANIPSLLLDLPGMAIRSLEKLKKMDPAPLFDPSFVSMIEPLEFGKDFSRLNEPDWIIEAVVEDLKIKRELLQSILSHVRDDAVVTTNTSGIPVRLISKDMPEDFLKRWFGTHFFNPPRYLKLLELIPTEATDPSYVRRIADFGDRHLGKGIVYAKDTPNFISNRLATFGGLYTLRVMEEDGYSIEEVDALTGPIVGRPKTATFRLFDLVGIDVMGMVAGNLYENAPNDEEREVFRLPKLIQGLLDRKWYGNKSGQGFYRKEGKDIYTLDPGTMEYRPRQKAVFPAVEMVRSMESSTERLSKLMASSDRAGNFLWKTTSAFLAYTANRIPEISDDIINIDNSMKWGFAWSHGPFELWDSIGVTDSVSRMRKEGKVFPAWMDDLLQQPEPRFYKVENGHKVFWDVLSKEFKAVPVPKGILYLDLHKKKEEVVRKNSGASLVDLGDGVLCLEFHSKLNTIGEDTIQMARAATDILEKDYEGLLIANQSENFSAGANLMLLLLEAQEGNWEELDLAIRTFQRMTMSFRYSPKPVVAAPFGLTLGGGCEISMGCDAIHSAAEVYIGLAETGVGLIPAGGGTKEILMRYLCGRLPDADPLPLLRKAFETVALAKIARSVIEAKKLRYLSDSDTFSMNGARVVQDAKNVVLQIAQSYRSPQPSRDILLTGRAGYAYLRIGIHLMREAGYISEHDAKIGDKIAWIMTGGDFTQPTLVDEQYVLDLEREAFLSLLGERKTQERIQHLLKTGKPLRN